MDRQQIMTLARHIYPENPQHLLRHFKEAISKPYGYLLIDLKPTTPEHLRLRIYVLTPIKSNKTGDIYHYLKDAPSSQTHLKPSTDQLSKFSEQTEASISSRDSLNSHLKSSFTNQLRTLSAQTKASIFCGKMSFCDDCGLIFENMHDLQRHLKRPCPENLSLKRKRDNENDGDQPPF